MPTLVEIATTYIEGQFDQIVILTQNDPTDQTTADHIETMMESTLQNLVSQRMISDYQTKSSAIGDKIYTSVIFNLTAGASYIHLSFESHGNTLNSKQKAKKDTAFDRAMKGV